MRPLTPEDKSALIETMNTPGWEVFSNIVSFLRDEAQKTCAIVNNDHRYFQGCYFSLNLLHDRISSKTVIMDSPQQRKAQDYS
jgi:hypothetical protein